MASLKLKMSRKPRCRRKASPRVTIKHDTMRYKSLRKWSYMFHGHVIIHTNHTNVQNLLSNMLATGQIRLFKWVKLTIKIQLFSCLRGILSVNSYIWLVACRQKAALQTDNHSPWAGRLPRGQSLGMALYRSFRFLHHFWNVSNKTCII